MNSRPMVLRFCFRVGDAGEFAEKLLRRINMDQRDIVVMPEQVDDRLGLVEPQQAVIDEDAGELVADRLMDQHCGDGGIDAAGQAADHLARPTWARIFSIASSRKARMVQSPVRPATLRTKLRISLAPSGVCTTSGWNIRP